MYEQIKYRSKRKIHFSLELHEISFGAKSYFEREIILAEIDIRALEFLNFLIKMAFVNRLHIFERLTPKGCILLRQRS